MYRLLPFLLIASLIAFAPAVLPGQDKDKPADAKQPDEKKTEEKKTEENKGEPAPPPTPVGKKDGKSAPKDGKEETVIWYKKGLYRVGEFISAWGPLAFLVMIIILLMGLRSDLGRIEEKLDKGGTGGAAS